MSARQRANPRLRDQEALDATDRTVAVDGLLFAGMGTALACGALAANDLQRSTWFWGSGTGFLVFFACMFLHTLIVSFNRPKCLVPPPFRDELGARASRRLRKRAGS